MIVRTLSDDQRIRKQITRSFTGLLNKSLNKPVMQQFLPQFLKITKRQERSKLVLNEQHDGNTLDYNNKLSNSRSVNNNPNFLRKQEPSDLYLSM